MTLHEFDIEDFKPEVEHVRRYPHPVDEEAMKVAVNEEMARRDAEGFPHPFTESEIQESVERWLDPEVISRTAIRHAIWEMERHAWTRGLTHCLCGLHLPGDQFGLMRAHREDVLAEMLGLTIKQPLEGED